MTLRAATARAKHTCWSSRSRSSGLGASPAEPVIAVWALLIAALADVLAGWPILAQLAFYALTGIIWIAPLGPLLRWMETGKWRE